MSEFNPYDIIIRPVGRFTSEKVFNDAGRLETGYMANYRKASRKDVIDRRDAIRAYTSLGDLSAEERAVVIRRRVNAAKRTMSPEAFKKVKKSLEEDEKFSKDDAKRLVRYETARVLKTRRAERRQQNTNQNKVVFIVRATATKPDIRRAIEQIYSVKVVRVNTLHTRRGKRAIIKLAEKDNAEEIYTRLGQI